MKLIMMIAGLGIAGVIGAGGASANPMCGPGNGPLGYLWPNVQVCQLYTPGLGHMARVPTVAPPHNIPYPQNNYATPFWPIQVNPVPPGGPYSPGG